MLAHEDFAGEDFRVHTRWIETDWVPDLAPDARPAPPEPTALQRMAIEIDGRRVAIALPPALLSGLAGGTAGPQALPAAPATSAQAVPAPVSGTLQAWKVQDGDTVAEGQPIAVMEAMKMEMQIVAHRAGRITLQAAAARYLEAGTAIAHIG